MIFVDAPRELRLSRVQKRGYKESKAFDEIEAHSTEVQVRSLGRLADLQIDGKRDSEDLADEVIAWLRNRLSN